MASIDEKIKDVVENGESLNGLILVRVKFANKFYSINMLIEKVNFENRRVVFAENTEGIASAVFDFIVDIQYMSLKSAINFMNLLEKERNGH